MITVSVCGVPAGHIQTSRGSLAVFNATWIPDMGHIMAVDSGGTDLCLLYDATHERVVAAARVNERGQWSIRPVLVRGADAVVAPHGADGYPHVPAAIEAMWASESASVEVAA